MNHHITAEFRLLDNVPEPKTKGVKSNVHSPHHRIEGVEYLCSGRHAYEDDNLHYPPEVLRTKVFFPSWQYIKDKILVGQKIQVSELDRVIGELIVLSVDSD
ncbi:hypothetical protein ACH50O_02815 [Methylomonas sp. 2BW1-5-20]|uniref:hypothetical protein n=1 Tax=Methylomonas sp. 2BW1-5-20 TaxID=3376686 RepID=UPI004051D362